jgi:hypothetical protein
MNITKHKTLKLKINFGQNQFYRAAPQNQTYTDTPRELYLIK